jgi:hypothetical protein
MFMFLYRAGRQRGISAALIRSQLRAECAPFPRSHPQR